VIFPTTPTIKNSKSLTFLTQYHRLALKSANISESYEWISSGTFLWLMYDIQTSLEEWGTPMWQFIPRDAMHSADYAVARCLSVCVHSCTGKAGHLWWNKINIANIFSITVLYKKSIRLPKCPFQEVSIYKVKMLISYPIL